MLESIKEKRRISVHQTEGGYQTTRIHFDIHDAVNLTGDFRILIEVDRTVNKVQVSFCGRDCLSRRGGIRNKRHWLDTTNELMGICLSHQRILKAISKHNA